MQWRPKRKMYKWKVNIVHDAASGNQAGAALPLEIERKYLIAYPDLAALERHPGCQRVDIVQTYLKTEVSGETARVRQWESEGQCLFFSTRKRTVSDMTRVELEEQITPEAYQALLARADPDCRPIRKRRYRLSENGLCYEIDVYPEWTDKAIMEIELTSEDQTVVLPDCVTVIREVTGDRRYSNHALARRHIDWPD